MRKINLYMYNVIQMFEHVLSELGPVCLAEQDFCVKYFSLTSESEPKDPKVQLISL